MPEFVRVRDSVTKHEYTIGADAVVDGLTVLDKPATNSGGAPLAAKPHVTTSSSTSGGAKKSTQATSAKAAASEEDTA